MATRKKTVEATELMNEAVNEIPADPEVIVETEEEVQAELREIESRVEGGVIKADEGGLATSDTAVKDGKIISISGTLEAKTQERLERFDRQIVYASRDNHSYLKGTVTSIKPYTTKEGNTIPLAIVSCGTIQIMVRPERFCVLTQRWLDTGRPRNELYNSYIRQTIGAEVDVIVTTIKDDPETGEFVVMGDRLAAMRVKRLRRYFGRNPRNEKDGSPHVYEGAQVEARVVGVRPSMVRVEVLGVICVLRGPELVFGQVKDLRTKFHVGESIVVKVMKLTKDEETGEVELELSHRATMENPTERNLHKYAPGQICMGRVYKITDRAVFVQFDDETECRCHHCIVPIRPTLGARCHVKIKNVDKERAQLFGKITMLMDI